MESDTGGYSLAAAYSWLGHVDTASATDLAERPALVERDHFLREHIYRLDPMNALASKFMEPDMVQRLIEARFGAAQLAEGARSAEERR